MLICFRFSKIVFDFTANVIKITINEYTIKSIKVAIADASKFSLIKNIQSLTNLQPELYAASINQISGFITRLEQGAPAKTKNQKLEQIKREHCVIGRGEGSV